MLERHDGVSVYWLPPHRLGIYLLREGDSVRRSHASMALSRGAAAALDGPMYDDIGSGKARMRFLHLDTAAGVDVASRSPSLGMTISVVGGTAYARTDAEVMPGASVAVQLYPELVRGSRNVSNRSVDTSSVWRAALGIRYDGLLGFAVGVAPMYQFAEKLRALGFVEAGYTDGGDSTTLALSDGTRVGDDSRRAVASWLIDVGDKEGESAIAPILVAIGLGWLAYEWSK